MPTLGILNSTGSQGLSSSSKLTEKEQHFTNTTNKLTTIRDAFEFQNSGLLESPLLGAPQTPASRYMPAVEHSACRQTCQRVDIPHANSWNPQFYRFPRSLFEVDRKSATLYQNDKQTHDGPERFQIPEFCSPGISTCGRSRFKNRDSTCRDQHVAHMPIVEHSACTHTCPLLNILHACQLLNILHVCTGPYWGHLEVMLDFLL